MVYSKGYFVIKPRFKHWFLMVADTNNKKILRFGMVSSININLRLKSPRTTRIFNLKSIICIHRTKAESKIYIIK